MPIRLVIDTNILFAAAVNSGGSRRLLEDVFSREDWRWLATDSIMAEYHKVIENTRFRLSREEREEMMERIREEVVLVEAGQEIKLEADPSDAKFLNCCAAGEADYLITSDSHLLNAPEPGRTRIMNVHDFYAEMGRK